MKNDEPSPEFLMRQWDEFIQRSIRDLLGHIADSMTGAAEAYKATQPDNEYTRGAMAAFEVAANAVRTFDVGQLRPPV